jgi:hypothetical protein
MAFSLRDAFRTLGRQINYRLELSGISLSEPVEKELTGKGWQLRYDLPAAYIMPAMGPCLPIITVKDAHGVGINEPGNERNREKFHADLREAAARHWLKSPPPQPA